MQSTDSPEPTRSAWSRYRTPIGAALAVVVGAVGIFLIAPSDDAGTPTAEPSQAAPAASPTPAASPEPTVAGKIGDINDVKVTGSATPALQAPTPFIVAKTTKKVLKAGTGKAVSAGQRLTIDFLGVNGKDGKAFNMSYGKPDKVTFTLGDPGLLKGMATGLAGVNVGSRVLLAIPPAEAYGPTGSPDQGIGPTDTLLWVIDVKSAATPVKPLTRAAGTAVKPKAGLPTVALDSATGKPTITIPKTAAPSSLVVQPLITGKGAKVTKGQTITVHYTGLIWASSKEFDSSWTTNKPASFPIGTGGVIPGWDKGLVGQTVGSQVLLVIPPADGYGTTGQSSAGITGTDTLVFVVDILGAE
ncbi:MAG TPA: FKBP-type peptidyl-prolyl cis-trans isomerase [Kineosporiaceae bacterium]|nr:FKBP-type peptidyl-prolyl cis-trans isomerase [Kineosporiaceae bacterium]